MKSESAGLRKFSSTSDAPIVYQNHIAPDVLTNWVPGELTLASDALGWSDVTLRSY